MKLIVDACHFCLLDLSILFDLLRKNREKFKEETTKGILTRQCKLWMEWSWLLVTLFSIGKIGNLILSYAL